MCCLCMWKAASGGPCGSAAAAGEVAAAEEETAAAAAAAAEGIAPSSEAAPRIAEPEPLPSASR
jgi:hypothetical protein